VGVERDLDADDARDHGDRRTGQHRLTRRAGVGADGDRRPDQDGQDEQRAEALNRHGDGGGE
jgi:hypothetical protein